MKNLFNRPAQLVSLFALAALVGCGSSPVIQVFTAGPASIPLGGSSALVFGATGSSNLKLSIDNGVGDVTGQTQVTVTPTATTQYTLTATDGSKSVTATTTVTVGKALGSIVLTGPSTATAGTAISVTATVKDPTGKTLTSYTGTVQLTSTDSNAVLPANYTFAAGDKGVHAFSVTLKSFGTQLITAQDTASASLTGTTSVSVSPAAAATCTVTGLPTTTAAGAALGARVTMLDANSNIAAGYLGTVALTSTDTAAVLPAPTAFGDADRGVRILPVSFATVGSQTLTVTDATNSITCTGTVAITPASTHLLVALPANINAGAPATGTILAADAFGNVITSYAGTVTLASSDALAVLPTAIVFTNGVAPITVTFNTIGSQTVTASDGGASTAGTAVIEVHGFTYVNPGNGVGKVQLVLNGAASSASLVQLDLVANTNLNPVQGFTVGFRGGAYAAGMNLPVDITKAVADTNPIVVPAQAAGGVLNLGTAPVAVGAALPLTGTTAGVFYSGISQKAAGAGGVTDDQFLAAGQVFYSIRLKLLPTGAPGVVFDGNNPGPQFRAAVRSITGQDVIQQPDFAIGKLVIQ